MSFNIVEEIRYLIDYLNARTKEYEEGNPTISDEEFDRKYFKLQEYETANGIVFNDSPTQHISYDVVNSLEKVTHNHDMLSLEKTKALDDIKDFLGNEPYLAMCKMDGLTCSLKYENGELISAETRGNGKIGENILHNAKVIPSIPKYIPYLETLVVDGEIICTKDDFKEFEKDYKNPRNFAAGSIRLLDSNECAKRKLKFVAWDVIEGFNDIKNLSNKLNRLLNYGFTVVPQIISSTQDTDGNEIELSDITCHLSELAKQLSYPIDGIVFKFDDMAYGRSLGQTAHHFKDAKAFKFVDDVYITKLLDIEWSMGRTGQLSPVAVFDPVDIDGSIVERASLHNLSILKETLHGYGFEGQKVEVIRANMIIPQIISAEEDNELLENKYFKPPEICPICNQPLKIKSDTETEFIICENPDCEGRLINKLDHFCGKKGLDIKGLSKATLEKLVDWEWVKSCKDIFTLSNYRDEWIKKPGFGIKSVDKLLNSIEFNRECELSAFICALGIPLIGSTASKELTKVFSTWESFIEAVESKYDFESIPNFGFEMNNAIKHFDYTEAKFIYENYLKIAVPGPAIEETELENSLSGVTAVITGKLAKFKNRDELKNIIESRGGKVAGSISSKTNYLINNDISSESAKNVSAKKLGIPIVSEDTFIEMFGIL